MSMSPRCSNEFGIPWPDADSGRARQAAEAWKALGGAAQAAMDQGNNAANVLCANNTGKAMSAFSGYWDEFGGRSSSANLPVLVSCCTAMANACDQFADAVDKAKHDIEEKAVEIGAAIGGGLILTLFTAGISDAAAEGVVAALVPEAIASFELLGTTVAAMATTVLSGAALGLLEATVAQVTSVVTKLGFGDTPKMPTMSDEISALVAGGITGSLGAGLTNSAKAGTAAAGLADDVNVVAPQLPKLLNSLPDAVDTPAGKALVDLVSKTEAQGIVNAAQGKSPEMPSTEEVVGALLDSKIEAAAESDSS